MNKLVMAAVLAAGAMGAGAAAGDFAIVPADQLVWREMPGSHGVRAAALDVLTEVLTAEGHGRTLPRTIPREPLPAARPTGCRVAVTVTNPAAATDRRAA